jgi:putative heme-binding domain-containing protein
MRGRVIAGTILFALPILAQHGSTTVVNPYTSPEHAQAGGTLYRSQCAGCHGLDGTGTGAGPSLTSGTFQRGGSDEELFRTISKGVPGTAMPAFSFSGLQVWELVTHLRAIGIVHGASQSKGDAEAGAGVFRAKCSGCHAVRGEGGLSGPDLTSVGSKRSYAELLKSVTDPDAEVASEYWSVSVTTSTGENLRGIRLNEDTHSLQIRDERGRLVSLLKRNITTMELIRRSPMPSFTGKLPDAQMADVIAYLMSLRGEQ